MVQEVSDRAYAETTVKHLLSVTGPEEAVSLLTEVFKSFKRKTTKV